MKSCLTSCVAFSILLLADSVRADVVLEPDNYADTTVLTNVIPGLTMRTMTGETTISATFAVTANTVTNGVVSTGTNTFGHSNIAFWWESRRLRMDFATPTRGIGIDAIGGTNFGHDIGVLFGYDAKGNLVDSYTTQPLAKGTAETMRLLESSDSISYAVAYAVAGPEGYGPFLGLDHLVAVSVPEPVGAVWIGVTMGAALLAGGRSRSRRRNAGTSASAITPDSAARSAEVAWSNK